MNNQDYKGKSYGFLKHLLCIVPIVVLIILYVTRFRGIPTGNILGVGLMILCPLSHLLIIPLIMRKKQKDTDEKKSSCH
ncbi:UNVERIFIED_CONTAM: hypothetical protein Cloal_1550 [Acetivibrio alkalicellulosi]